MGFNPFSSRLLGGTVEPSLTCCLCELPMPEPDGTNAHLIGDKAVYKCGELQYFELAHIVCAVAKNEELAHLEGSWTYTPWRVS